MDAAVTEGVVTASAVPRAASLDEPTAPSLSCPGTAAAAPKTAQGHGSIRDVFAGLCLIQEELKEKIKSPSNRKAGPPRVKRKPQPTIMSDTELEDKMNDIGALEQQLAAARAVASAASATANALSAMANGTVANQSPSGHPEADGTVANQPPSGHPEADGTVANQSPSGHPEARCSEMESQRLAQERVRTKRKQEALKRNEIEQQLAEDRAVKKAVTETKVQELARFAKARVHENMRKERLREEKEQRARALEQEQRETRATLLADELALQAKLRIQERQAAFRQKTTEEKKAMAEVEIIKNERENSRVAEFREITRLRVQRISENERKRRTALEEEERQRRIEAEHNAEKCSQEIEMNKKRAQIRAMEFKIKMQQQEAANPASEDVSVQKGILRGCVPKHSRGRDCESRGDTPEDRASGLQQHCGADADSDRAPPKKSFRRKSLPPVPTVAKTSSNRGRLSLPRLCPDKQGGGGGGGAAAGFGVPLQTVVNEGPDGTVKCTVGVWEFGGCEVDDFEEVVEVPRLNVINSAEMKEDTMPMQARASSSTCSTPLSKSERNPDFDDETCASSAIGFPRDQGPIGMRNTPAKSAPWKQKVIQVKPADYYLNLIKQSRSGGGKGKCGADCAQQVRMRADDIEEQQRQLMVARENQVDTALRRVQSRALQAAPQHVSCQA